MATIHLSDKTYQRIRRHLTGARTEQVAFLFLARIGDPETDGYEVVDYYLVPDDELVAESSFHAEITAEAQAKIIKMAWDRRLILGEVHSHKGSYFPVEFSPSDLHGFAEFVPHVWWRLKGGPYFAFVFGKTDFDAIAWLEAPNDPVGIEGLQVKGKTLTPTGITVRTIQEQKERERVRYSRQEALFGEEGQRKIKASTVTIVGVGGLGSHIAQQLAYLGVQKYILIDPDTASRSNLNRLIGATESDIGKRKVDVAERLIRSIQPTAEAEKIAESLISLQAYGAVRRSDIVFGCPDNDGVRMILLDLCCTYKKPYLDLASDVPDEKSFGGRVVFAGLGKGCPLCLGEYDQDEIRRFFATPEQRREEHDLYGVDRAALGETGPSLVSVNGIIASIAVTEFMVFVTGLRSPYAHLVYRGEMGTVNRPVDQPPGNCFYCCGIWNGTERGSSEKYLPPKGNQENQKVGSQ